MLSSAIHQDHARTKGGAGAPGVAANPPQREETNGPRWMQTLHAVQPTAGVLQHQVDELHRYQTLFTPDRSQKNRVLMLTQERRLADLMPAPLDKVVQLLPLGKRQSLRIPPPMVNNLGTAAAQQFVKNPETSLISRPTVSSESSISPSNSNHDQHPRAGHALIPPIGILKRNQVNLGTVWLSSKAIKTLKHPCSLKRCQQASVEKSHAWRYEKKGYALNPSLRT